MASKKPIKTAYFYPSGCRSRRTLIEASKDPVLAMRVRIFNVTLKSLASDSIVDIGRLITNDGRGYSIEHTCSNKKLHGLISTTNKTALLDPYGVVYQKQNKDPTP